ncbi:MAG: cell wall-binding repeat-containing protein, partial [Actinomycetota bacterium]
MLGIPFAAAQEAGGDAPDDAGDIVIAGPEGAQAAAQLSQATSSEGTSRVMLASDASFADALASAVLQQDGPLLLVPPTLPLPGAVIGELERLAPTEVTLLGGESAIGQDVEEELQRIGFATSRIAGATRGQAQFWAEAAGITQDLLGSATTSNIFVVGMAVQAGCLPVSAERLEEAIRLNGVAIDANLTAFRWGRLQISDSLAVDRARSEL